MSAVNDLEDASPPTELSDWREQNRHVIDHVEGALKAADAPLTEQQLWNLIARTYSPAWAEARSLLTTTEQKINIHKSPENRALGAIGMALESNEINHELAAYDGALAAFTILNEELRQNPALQNLLKSLVESQQLLEETYRLSRDAARVTASFAEVASPDHVDVRYGSPIQVLTKMAKRLFNKPSIK